MLYCDPASCSCACHQNPDTAPRMDAVDLLGEYRIHRLYFRNAELRGFNNPVGHRCRDCHQLYGYSPGTRQLEPIRGNFAPGPHPASIAAGWLAPVARLWWQAMEWVTMAWAPMWLRERIHEGLYPPTWSIVTRWTMKKD